MFLYILPLLPAPEQITNLTVVLLKEKKRKLDGAVEVIHNAALLWGTNIAGIDSHTGKTIESYKWKIIEC